MKQNAAILMVESSLVLTSLFCGSAAIISQMAAKGNCTPQEHIAGAIAPYLPQGLIFTLAGEGKDGCPAGWVPKA